MQLTSQINTQTASNTGTIVYNPVGINGTPTSGDTALKVNFLGSSGLSGSIRPNSALEGSIVELYAINKSELTAGELRLLLISAILEALAGRAKARRLGLLEAELALNFGLRAADKQRQAAMFSFAGELASGTIQMVAGAADAIMAGVTIAKLNTADKAIRANADRIFNRPTPAAATNPTPRPTTPVTQAAQVSDAPAPSVVAQAVDVADDAVDAPAIAQASSKPKKAFDIEDGPPEYDECLDTPAKRAKYQEVLDEANKNKKQTTDADEDPIAVQNEIDKARYISQERHTITQRYDRYAQLVHAITTLMTAGGKVMGAGLQFVSAEHNAQASREQAYGQYRHAVAQMHTDFASEQLTYLRGVMELISSMESARHQAVGGVWGA